MTTRTTMTTTAATRYQYHTNNTGSSADPDMPTFENQKEESLTMEARRADNRGPKGRQ